jgi:hypothetical protein
VSDEDDPGLPIPKLDLSDPQVQAEIARAKRAAELAHHLAPPGERKYFKGKSGREGYLPVHESNRRNTDPRGPTQMPPMGAVAGEVIRLISGRNLSLSRAQAVKRVVRRIRQIMGPDAPAASILKWWVAEMISLLEEEESGMVRVGVLRVIAESIGLLRAGVGLMSTAGKRANYVPVVNFKMVESKDSLKKIGTPIPPTIELKAIDAPPPAPETPA